MTFSSTLKTIAMADKFKSWTEFDDWFGSLSIALLWFHISYLTDQALLQFQDQTSWHVLRTDAFKGRKHFQGKRVDRFPKSWSIGTADSSSRIRKWESFKNIIDLKINFASLISREMEAQGSHTWWSLQRLRFVPGSGNAWTWDSSQWRSGGVWYGWLVIAANMAIHSTIRKENCRLVARFGPVENQRHSHRQPTENLPNGFRSFQAFLARETAWPNHLPWNWQRVSLQTHRTKVPSNMLRRNHRHTSRRWKSMARTFDPMW